MNNFSETLAAEWREKAYPIVNEIFIRNFPVGKSKTKTYIKGWVLFICNYTRELLENGRLRKRKILQAAKLAEKLADLTDRIFEGEQIDIGEADQTGELGDLAKTVQKLQAASQATPDPAFAIRLRNLSMAALPKKKETVSERLQDVINRLIGDEEFRTNFFASPETTLQRAGFQLSPAEIAALKEMEPENLEEWLTDLDERISKSGLL